MKDITFKFIIPSVLTAWLVLLTLFVAVNYLTDRQQSIAKEMELIGPILEKHPILLSYYHPEYFHNQ